VASWMDRVRAWLGNGEHTEEHAEVRRELTAQQLRIKALDAYVEARGSRLDRRRTFVARHPNRRAGD
jgi:hypothetical protein